MNKAMGHTTTHEALDLEPIRARLNGLDPEVALDQRALLAEVDRLAAELDRVAGPVANANIANLARDRARLQAKLQCVEEVINDRRLWIFPDDRDTAIEVGVIRAILVGGA